MSRSNGNLALDKGKSLLAILGTIALVRRGIGSVAAVRVRSIAVRLDLGRVRAREARWAGIELVRNKTVSMMDTKIQQNGASYCSFCDLLLRPCRCRPHTTDRSHSVDHP